MTVGANFLVSGHAETGIIDKVKIGSGIATEANSCGAESIGAAAPLNGAQAGDINQSTVANARAIIRTLVGI